MLTLKVEFLFEVSQIFVRRLLHRCAPESIWSIINKRLSEVTVREFLNCLPIWKLSVSNHNYGPGKNQHIRWGGLFPMAGTSTLINRWLHFTAMVWFVQNIWSKFIFLCFVVYVIWVWFDEWELSRLWMAAVKLYIQPCWYIMTVTGQDYNHRHTDSLFVEVLQWCFLGAYWIHYYTTLIFSI